MNLKKKQKPDISDLSFAQHLLKAELWSVHKHINLIILPTLWVKGFCFSLLQLTVVVE